MNPKQRKHLWIGITVFVLMGLFPPCYISRTGEQSYTFLFQPLLADTNWAIDTHRLYVQWIMVAVVTGGLMLKSHGSEPTKPSAGSGN